MGQSERVILMTRFVIVRRENQPTGGSKVDRVLIIADERQSVVVDAGHLSQCSKSM